MFTFIVLCSLAAWASAMPQFGGGSAGGLLGHHEPLDHVIIGLSRGQEEETHQDIQQHHESGGSDGGDSHNTHEEIKHHESHGSNGFGGSNFGTPVDVHHEEAIHFKAHPEYHYDYHVADHKHKDYKSKHEVRDGYKVKGSYSLLEPDHKTIRVVDYVSDHKLGFIAKVSHKKHQ